MKINGHVEARGAKAADQRELRGEPGETPPSRRDDDFIEKWISGDDWGRGRFDDVGEVRVGKPLAQPAYGRRRENDVPDLAKANQENPLGGGWILCDWSIPLSWPRR